MCVVGNLARDGLFAGTTVLFITSNSFCVSYIYIGAVGLSNVHDKPFRV